MNESKLSYLAIALSAGAFLISGLTAGISALPNSASLASQHEELSRHEEELSRQKLESSKQSAWAADNEQRLREFQIALIAVANAAKIEPSVLSKSFEDAKAASEQAGSETHSQANPAPMPNTKVDEFPVNSLATSKATPTPQAKPVELALQPAAAVKASAPTLTKANELALELEATAQSTKIPQTNALESDVEDALKENPKVAPVAGNLGGSNESMAAPGAKIATLAEQVNPFRVDDVASTLSVAPGHVVEAKATIQQVDGILGQRISENWYKPANTPADVSTVVQLSMARNGKVTAIKLAKSSGNEPFDESAMSAMNSIGEIAEVAHLPDADYTKAYASRLIKFTPQMGK